MSRPSTAVGPTLRERWRTARWVVLVVSVLAVVAVLGVLLSPPQSGGRMDPEATTPEGAHALVTLLDEQGVEVVTAGTVDEVVDAARPDTLLVLAQLFYLDEDQLRRLDGLPGDRLLIAPSARAREILAPQIRTDGLLTFGGTPDCDMREATRAGDVNFGIAETFTAADDSDVDLTRCYDGAVVRFTDGDRVTTVVGSSGFMSNGALADGGNAALALNLAGTQPRVVWFAPQQPPAESTGDAALSDLIPEHVGWIVWQLIVVVVLLAWWQGRRLGPLVTEPLPVVVRASETVEGRGRLYRSRRARDRAAEALRTGAVQRLVSRLGLQTSATPSEVTLAVAARSGRDPAAVNHVLYGPVPATDADLVTLAHELDDIERQVAQS
ncbi:DUF4350 domain-containing protein [Mycolicibacterium thermoresistibile]|jgi:hypothetical protein|uniref:DUF4350 domain-containing protein n=2 Tax=Mycolicibacterium thermoresistibile TaxID=1797 RepID=G7CFH0_MYCT3|nr:DUF4350 domain-containing protein [Mycolicibacterium thermoresistibile]EHI13249.1 hypothetical protein KEK_08707 [Mycolicibacterium thermoresistibile ATCC 19527]MCV7186939.1 DUF4350 domain-containing protein [Mycolicibacterium thermoresistibile]GAT13112.1 putative uncharacterized protein [Mycolicibacterium thermoresistibile]SNW20436.1 membrane protein [Mycolicibacterium thermoresistibile]